MPLLPPTVHGRLARCGTRVLVTGLVAGADVTLTVDGTDHNFVATGPQKSVVVPSLVGTTSVHVQQDDGSGPTGLSPAVVVEEVGLPPLARPQLPSQVGFCSQCVHVWGLVPGCEVLIVQEGNVVGDALANRHGNACVKVDLEMRDETGILNARMVVCGQDGPLAATSIVPDSVTPKPVVNGTLYGCQRVVPISNAHPGSRPTPAPTSAASAIAGTPSMSTSDRSSSLANQYVHNPSTTAIAVKATARGATGRKSLSPTKESHRSFCPPSSKMIATSGSITKSAAPS